MVVIQGKYFALKWLLLLNYLLNYYYYYYFKWYQTQNMPGNYESEVKAYKMQSSRELVMGLFFNLSKFKLKYY